MNLASTIDEALYKQVKTQRGFTYSYFFSPPTAGKPVIFFSHGFPSSSYVWREQVAFFKPLGFGLVVPDLLGYGGTDRPTDPKLYIGSGLAQDVVNIFDAEGIAKVIAVGHDWGSSVVSRLINLHPNRVSACAFVTVGYGAPNPAAKAVITQPGMMTKMVGYETFAYMRFFCQPDAAEIIEKNIDSFLCLVYPEKTEIWKDNMCVEGGARAWIEGNTINPVASYMTPELLGHERSALLKGGLAAPLCWYKVLLEDAKAADDAAVPAEAHAVMQPLLFVASTRDPVCLPIFGDTNHGKHAKGVVTRREIAGDHWVLESHAAETPSLVLKVSVLLKSAHTSARPAKILGEF
ncbi:alpha/beta-hydrolase [Mycena rosella]|uniref:Alpha/beta-hydrolase n=1 Tax=Mycena rosella TaxID=1033263 RepID=A0AAD7CLJ3_MYCRO|nr:alpha/beta-hydrolase [Mycena rosella]